MILPAALPASPALSSTAPTPADTPETGGEFAALLGLGLMLDGGTAEPAAIPSTGPMPAPIALPIAAIPGDNTLPYELPPLAPMIETDAPQTAVPGAIITPAPVEAFIPLPPVTAPTEGSAETNITPTSQNAAHWMPVQLAEGTAAVQLPQPRTEQVQAIAIPPRLALPAADEPTPTVSSATGRIHAGSVEGVAPPAPAAPQLTFVVADAPTSALTSTAPSPVRSQVPHDFAALVDRLVDARDTARAVHAPQTVSASLAHADFGDIAIRFEHGGAALAVALSSPDPEFIRAVQAAAPTSQANDNGTATGRQDGSGQQTAGSSGQPPQSQTQQRGGHVPRGPSPHEHGPDKQRSGRSDIFA